jgi:hypothetical protein
MPKRIAPAQQPVSLVDLAGYHRDAESSLRLYFTPVNPDFTVRFASDRPSEVEAKLADRLSETDMRFALAIMARVEAAFRIDYQQRCEKKKPDPISIAFRALSKARGRNVRLEDDIWEVWRQSHPSTRPLISQLRSVFKFRHWLAHGRYWQVGSKYDFQTLYLLADGVLATFPLYG